MAFLCMSQRNFFEFAKYSFLDNLDKVSRGFDINTVLNKQRKKAGQVTGGR